MAVTSGPQCSLNLKHSSADVRVSMAHTRFLFRLPMLQMVWRTTVTRLGNACMMQRRMQYRTAAQCHKRLPWTCSAILTLRVDSCTGPKQLQTTF